MQKFEKHTRLAQHIERMAVTGRIGNAQEWNEFIILLNSALEDEGKRKAPCERFCEAAAFEIEIRQLKAARSNDLLRLSSMKTVSGRKARVICNNRHWAGNKFPILALIESDGGNEIAIPYNTDLKCENSQHFPNEDLSLVNKS